MTVKKPRLPAARDTIQGSILTYIVGLFILTRLLYMGLGTMGFHILSQGLSPATTAYPAKISSHQPVQMWYVWDAQHYANAARGYNFSLSKLPVAGQKDGRKLYYLVHWFPVYPVSAKLFHQGTRISLPYSLLIVSNLAFIAALYFLYKLLRVDADGEDDTFARLVLAVFFVLPASFVFSAALSESMFLLLSVLTLYMARRQRWFLAGLFGFLVALTRSAGFLIALPVALEAIQQYGFHKKQLVKTYWQPLIACLLPIVSLLLFMVYGWYRTGDLLNYTHGAYVGWEVVFANPFAYIFHTLGQVRTLVVLTELAAVAACYKKLRWSFSAYTLVLATAALSVGATAGGSSLRYLAPAFPIAIAVAYLMQRPRWQVPLWISLGSIHGVFFLLWAAWWTGFII